MPQHALLRFAPTSRTVPRLARGIAVFALVLPLAACGTGTDPRDPDPSTPAESSSTADPSDDAADSVDPVGRWSSPEAGDPFLEFAEDGSLRGSDGCNAISTTWEVEDDEVIIESFMTTQKACAGVDTWLSDAASASIEGDVMKIKDHDGKVIGGLEKDEE